MLQIFCPIALLLVANALIARQCAAQASQVHPLWPGAVFAETYGADPTGRSSSDSALDNAVAEAHGGCIIFGAGKFLLSRAHVYTSPICIMGVGKGVGPGAAAHDYSHVTEFLINLSNEDVFTITSNVGSRLENFRVNISPSKRPQVAGYAFVFNGDAGAGTVASTIIRNIGFTQVCQPIKFVKPAWPEITGNYFDNWCGPSQNTAAITCVTTAGVEGSCGFIHHNVFRGQGSGPALYSEVGYTDFHDNEALSSSTVLNFNIRNYPAGYIKIHDNTIENYGINGSSGVTISSNDGSNVGYLMFQHNEMFSLSKYRPMHGLSISDNEMHPNWIRNVLITANHIRQGTAEGGDIIHVGAGMNVVVANNVLQEDAVSAPIGINVNGTSTNSGISAPFIVADNVMTGTFGAKYSFSSTAAVTFRDMVGSTVDGLPPHVKSGSQAVVTDGIEALNWGARIIGGGTTGYQVWFNGSEWNVSGK